MSLPDGSNQYRNIDSDDEFEDDLEVEKPIETVEDQCRRPSRRAKLIIIGVVVAITLTLIVRPRTPYTLMSTTLPLAMLEALQFAPDVCAEQAKLNSNEWPYPDLVDMSKWVNPDGHFKGWAPGSDKLVKQYRETTPSWLPDTSISGFSKWASKEDKENDDDKKKDNDDDKDANGCPLVETDGTFYNPVNDPMKITNLDRDVLDVLKETFDDDSIKIKHVALVMMESYREELFPLQQDSDYHKFIIDSFKDKDVDMDEINTRLAHLSPVAERLTGKAGGFKLKDGSDIEPADVPQWNDTTREGYGGINVQGGFTTSSLSFKSMSAIHCGAWSMPVDSFEEADHTPYQPCIPQILDMLNRKKDKESKSDDYLEQQWYPAFFQSITDGYDRQKKFDNDIGFQHIVTKHRLDHDAREANKELEEINYFGYAETTLTSHIEDYLKEIKEEGKRMFLSHFTSTTHHPWGTPKDFKSQEYIEDHSHKDFNNYLNAIRFTDAWLGQLMQMLDDFDMSDDTLIVFVGDHGQAFKEDASKTGTYENGHVSNFRVPITFRHPQIPRVQYKANATSLSILPTILDLLINTHSLNNDDTDAMADLIQDYEGQSLIRPYKANDNGRRAWNFGIINGGGRMLSITSADAPWRFVLPLDEKSEFRFTDLAGDPLELHPQEDWTMDALSEAVKQKHGDEAMQWLVEAEKIGRWWGLERKRLWGYNAGSSDHDKDD